MSAATGRATMFRYARDAYGDVAVLRGESVPVRRPGPGEVLVRVVASSVNTADLEHLEGRPWLSRIGTGMPSPRNRVPGFDVVGVVEEVGEAGGSTVAEPRAGAPGGVRRAGGRPTRGDGAHGRTNGPLRPGDRVWADLFSHGAGAFAPYVCAPAAAFRRLPDGIDPARAAGVPHSGGLALQALAASGGVRRGDRVLVNGAGGCVGPFAIQLAKLDGAHVTAVDDAARAPLMRAAGADVVVDRTRVDVTRGGERFDVVVDLAATRAFTAFRRILAPRGRYTLVARDVTGFVAAGLLGRVVGGRRRMGVFGWQPNRRADLESLGALLASGRLRTIVDSTYRLDEVPEALERVASRRAIGGKVIVLGTERSSW